MTVQRKRRQIRFFRISLRTLLVLMLLSGLACGWVAMKRQQSRRQTEAVAALVELSREGMERQQSWRQKVLVGGRIGDRWECSYWERHPDQPVVLFDSGPFGERQPRGRSLPAWLRRITGEECFHKVIAVNLAGDKVAPEHLAHLATFRDLQSLNLDYTDQDPGRLEQIGKLQQLKRLCLGENAISDAGLHHLGHLTQLQELELWHNPITDDGLLTLASLKRLERLNLWFTQVTSKGVNRLQQTLPECKIWWDECETFRFIGNRSLFEPNPVDIIRAVNHLHSLGKQEAVLALQEYTRLYEDQSLNYIVPLLFPNPPSQATVQPGPHKSANWPDSYTTVQVQDEIPFYRRAYPSLQLYSITPEVIDWVAENCELRKQPLQPNDEPFVQAKLLHANMCEKLDSGPREEVKESLAEFLQDQAHRMVSHLNLENPKEAKLRWSDERQEYVLAEAPRE